MGHVNLPAKRIARQWKILDLVSTAFFIAVFVFFLLVFTPLGYSVVASGRQALVVSMSDPKQRQRLLSLVELGQLLEPCPADAMDHMPCEDLRRNSQLSRERNFYRERHCPVPDETPLCLILLLGGYQVPVPWPESMYKYGMQHGPSKSDTREPKILNMGMLLAVMLIIVLLCFCWFSILCHFLLDRAQYMIVLKLPFVEIDAKSWVFASSDGEFVWTVYVQRVLKRV